MLNINKSGNRLSQDWAILFHRLVTKFLFFRKRARPYIHPTIEFLTTRVQDPDEDYWQNIQHILQYLHGTHEMAVYLNNYVLNILHWWVDPSYNVNDDIKGHTRSTMSIGRRFVNSISNKQKIDNTSTDQGKVFGVYDC